MANHEMHGPNEPFNREGVSRRPRDTRQYGQGAMGPEDYAFDEDEQAYDGRQGYYRSRPQPQNQQRAAGRSGGGQGQQRQGTGKGREDDQWAQEVRQQWQQGPYRDYGWESGESALPEFRDPSVRRMPYEEQEQQQQNWQGRKRGEDEFRRAYDAEHDRFPSGERALGTGGQGRASWDVTGPYVGRGPKGYQRSNERIQEDVCERLAQHGQIDASDIEVRVDSGQVFLTGTVDSRRTKRMAEDVIDSVPGVKDIHNELRVQAAAGQGGAK